MKISDLIFVMILRNEQKLRKNRSGRDWFKSVPLSEKRVQ